MPRSPEIKRINTRAELILLARDLRVREDWHEPDEQEVTATCHGKSFDNAGFWGAATEAEWREKHADADGIELWVTIHQEGIPVAEVNLATLFAWATGFENGDDTVSAMLRDTTWDVAKNLELLSTKLAGQARQLRDISNTQDRKL